MACIAPNVMPRPYIGLVQARASPSAMTPVTIGWRSTTRLVRRSGVADIVSTSVVGSASVQWASSG